MNVVAAVVDDWKELTPTFFYLLTLIVPSEAKGHQNNDRVHTYSLHFSATLNALHTCTS